MIELLPYVKLKSVDLIYSPSKDVEKRKSTL
jgi:hypothetical protein